MLSTEKFDDGMINVYGQEPSKAATLMRNNSIADQTATLRNSEAREMPVSKQNLKEMQMGDGSVD